MIGARARYSVEPATFRDSGAPVKGLPDHRTPHHQLSSRPSSPSTSTQRGRRRLPDSRKVDMRLAASAHAALQT